MLFILYINITREAGIAFWLERRTLDRKVASSNPGRSSAIFFLQSNVCAHSNSVSVPPLLPQWHVKDPGHSAKSVGSKLHLNTHTTLTKRSRSGLTMPLSRHSVGNYQETSSHATRQETLGHSRLSSLSHSGLKSGIGLTTILFKKGIHSTK